MSSTLDQRALRAMLNAYRAGELDEQDVMAAFATHHRGFEESPLGRFDTEREHRTGVPEAIFAEGKSVAMLCEAFERALDVGEQLIATRLTPPQREALGALPVHLDETARMAHALKLPEPDQAALGAIVLAAGTSDLAVAREAALTCELLALPTETLFDVGVAGLHRLLHDLERVRAAGVVIVAAGMDGALPSVVAGLVRAPVIAVPTSVGYGASFGGIAALLTMLNSCAPGVAVCNIDNGFGAAVLAKKIASSSRRDEL